jgi:translation elongation factor EF-G
MSLKKSNTNRVTNMDRLQNTLDKFISSINIRLSEQDEEINRLKSAFRGGIDLQEYKEFPEYILLNWPKGSGDYTKAKIIQYNERLKNLQHFKENNCEEEYERSAIYKLVDEDE